MWTESWLETAKTLAIDTKTRGDCGSCGGDNTVIINHNIKEYSSHCFKCGENEYQMKGLLTLQELYDLNNLPTEVSEEIKLPHDFTEDIPVIGRLWLYKCGLTETEWRKYGIGYSEYYKRVIMPIYRQGELVWYQGRALYNGQKPKYIQPSAARDTIMFNSKPDEVIIEDTVICEDIMSAIRVGKFCNAVSILGTKVTTAQLNVLAQGKVITWLDSDKAGRSGAIALHKQLKMLTTIKDICTEEDPKCLSNEQIKNKLKNK